MDIVFVSPLELLGGFPIVSGEPRGKRAIFGFCSKSAIVGFPSIGFVFALLERHLSHGRLE
jgi:hypothetical protein